MYRPCEVPSDGLSMSTHPRPMECERDLIAAEILGKQPESLADSGNMDGTLNE